MPRKSVTVNSRVACTIPIASPASLPLKRVFSGVTTPPTDWHPSAVTAHSQLFGAQIATRSPGCTPEAIIARAASPICATSSGNDHRTSPSTMPSTSAYRSAARRRTAGIVSGVASVPCVSSATGRGS